MLAPAPKIYHLHPLVAGPIRSWGVQFRRARELGFNWICLAPPFGPGESGDMFLPADLDRMHPALGWDGTAETGIAFAAAEAERAGLKLMMDVRLDRVARSSVVRRDHPQWFEDGLTDDLPDPRRPPRRLDASYARYGDTETADDLAGWWSGQLQKFVKAGLSGLRCIRPWRTPSAVWRRVIGDLRAASRDTAFLAWMAGGSHDALANLEGLAFDRVTLTRCAADFNEQMIEEANGLLRVAPIVGFPEPSFQDRLVRHVAPDDDPVIVCRQALHLAASVGNGLFVPMGFEYASDVTFDPARADPGDLDRARERMLADLSPDIVEASSVVDEIARLDVDGALRVLTTPGEPSWAFLRANAPDVREATVAAVVVVNPRREPVSPQLLREPVLPPQAGAPFGSPKALDGEDPLAPLEPGGTRILAYRRMGEVKAPRKAEPLDPAVLRSTRLAIEAVSPVVPGGDFPVKSVIGALVTVGADIFAEGHDALAAALKWRAEDEAEWREVLLHPIGNDRWEGAFTPARVGRHFYTIEAWWDGWGTFRHDLHLKHRAGQAIGLEIREGIHLIEHARNAAKGTLQDELERILSRLSGADDEQCVTILLSPETLAAMQAADQRPFRATLPNPVTVQVERPQAAFASWYELFPRSVTSDPSRHGTFRDVIGRLPAIRDMGFDVLYFPPISPIGKTNRKGRNNALKAEPGDVGSPYAIGDETGGHDAVHPQLGTIEDFRVLVAAAKAHGLEIAIDFAIQCSPDHPWLKQHPDWFRWRPDGSLRYAENPPKKYEDIVNPDFYAEASIPSLWLALRDVVAFWIGQGVETFRVDNPHTKPLPFWRWMIADIQAKHPNVIFLSEAFTRPKVMYRLAKVGFTQSYTYFTWRNTKAELTEYMTELMATPARECFRPNFFVNTPDINPVFLQTSGRPGFLIRAALATTLSGLWGMYSGFEICEATPLPGREEYLDSEKYEIRPRDFNAPGNIVAEITRLNALRRSYPVLQNHLNLTFYEADNPNVLLYGKQNPGEREIILVAVSLDPHNAQETTIEVPLWRIGLPDSAIISVRDLMRNVSFTWTGKYQRHRLDPSDMPFSIWHLTVPGAGA